MEYSENEQKRCQAEGWHSIGDKYCCSQCINDEYLKQLIEKNGQEGSCSYCKDATGLRHTLHLDKLLSLISSGLKYLYQFAEDCDDIQLLASKKSTSDILQQLNVTDDPILLGDITAGFSNRDWCRVLHYGLWQHEMMGTLWDDFCRQVRFKTRYVFYKTKEGTSSEPYPGCDEPFGVLDQLDTMIRQYELNRTASVGYSFVRARQHDDSRDLTDLSDFGPPTPEKAAQNRMSAAGISLFYCADSDVTAFAETYDENKLEKRAVSFGYIKTKRELKIVDFGSDLYIPSLFDQGNRHYISPMRFLSEFIKDVTKPFVRDDRIHYDYVPTQIITEYLRHIYVVDRDKKIDGIRYRSCRFPVGYCFVLFPNVDREGNADLWFEETFSLTRTRKVLIESNSASIVEYEGDIEKWNLCAKRKEVYVLSTTTFPEIEIQRDR